MKITSMLRLGVIAALLALAPSLALAQAGGTNVNMQVNAQTGTTYTFAPSDCGKHVTFSNTASIAATLPQAGSSGFFGGCTISVANIGAGQLTVTPTTSTIDGVATAVIPGGTGVASSFFIFNNSTHAVTGNYFTNRSASTVWPYTARRNLIDNSSFVISQRYATAQSGAINATAVYTIDRWIAAGGSSSAIKIQQSTSSPPTATVQFANFQHTGSSTSGLNCIGQPIKTTTLTPYAASGTPLSLSYSVKAGSAFNTNVDLFSVVFLTGTGTDESASTAIANYITAQTTGYTTGAAVAYSSGTVPITTSWTRNGNIQIAPASTATEGMLLFCMTATTSGGSTDAFNIANVQLEAGTVSTPFEIRPYDDDLKTALTYNYAITENAVSGTAQSASGQGATTTTCQLYFPFPMVMRAAPTYYSLPSPLTTSTWTVTHVATATALTTGFLAVLGAETTSGASMTATVASGLTAGQTCQLTSANGSSVIGWSADL